VLSEGDILKGGRKKVTGNSIKVHNEELRGYYSLSSTM
jgi:hypothetical protein